MPKRTSLISHVASLIDPVTHAADQPPVNLDTLLHQSWLKISHRILSNPLELQRRLDRRAKACTRTPRPLCLALKASDHRINPLTFWLSPRDAMDKGNEVEHDVLLVGRTIKNLCRPVELYWSQEFRDLARDLGAPRQVPRQLEKRGLLRARRIANLAGRHGLPIPLVTSPVPAMAPDDARDWEHYGYPTLLDPCARHYTAPDKLLLPYWQNLSLRTPDSFEQTIRRKPIFAIQRGRRRFMHWVWLCPGCHRHVNTLFLPIGAPDFATLHQIEIPSIENRKSKIENPTGLACQRCHHIFSLARTPKSIHISWSLLVAHLSSGLLFGHEVPRPASFSALRKNQPTRSRPSPRRDELESYLTQTDLSLKEIARRMGWTYNAVLKELHTLCKKRHLKPGRASLQHWWNKTRPRQTHRAA